MYLKGVLSLCRELSEQLMQGHILRIADFNVIGELMGLPSWSGAPALLLLCT